MTRLSCVAVWLAQAVPLAAIVTLFSGAFIPQQAPAGRIEGVVRDNGQHTVPGVTVSIRRLGEGTLARAITDAAGTFVLDHVPFGTYDVDLALSGFDITRQHSVTVSAGTPTQDLDGQIDVAVQCECVDSEEDPKAVILSAWIVDGANRPVPHAAPQVRAGSKTFGSGYSGRDGEVEVQMRPDAHLALIVSDEAFETATIDLRLPRQPNRPLIVRLVAKPSWAEPRGKTEVLHRRCRCANDVFQQNDGQ